MIPLREQPLWTRVLRRMMVAAVIFYIAAAVLVLGREAARLWLDASPSLRIGVPRLLAGALYGLTVIIAASAVRRRLFLTGDVGLLLTMPLSDAQRFARQAWLNVRDQLPLMAIGFLFALGFLVTCGTSAAAYAVVLAVLVLLIASALAIAHFLVLYEPLRTLFGTAVLLALLLFVATIGVRPHLEAGAYERLWAWWPGALAADTARLAAGGHWSLVAAKLARVVILFIALPAVLAIGSIRGRYRVEHVLAARAAVRDDKEKEGDSASRTGGPLQPRWSPRTHALVSLITRREHPEAVLPRVAYVVMAVGAAVVVGYICQSVAIRQGSADPEVVARIGFVIAAILLFPLVVIDFAYMPRGARRVSLRELHAAPEMAGHELVKMIGNMRGRHDHPLIETLPVSIREFTRMLMRTGLATLGVYLAILLLATPLVPFRRGEWLLLLTIFAAVGMLNAIGTPFVHAESYMFDHRRRELYRILRGLELLAIIIGGMIGYIALLVVARSLGLAVLFSFVVLTVIAAVGGVVLHYRAILRKHDRHLFDAEYLRRTTETGRW